MGNNLSEENVIYRSNLKVEDLSHFFRHMVSAPMPHSFGHDVPRDWGDKAMDDPEFGIWTRCGSWTHDELAILTAWAKRTTADNITTLWADIGCNTGMVSKYINRATASPVCCVDYMLEHPEFSRRFTENTGFPQNWQYWMKSDEFFQIRFPEPFAGVVIDGDHDTPQPATDAVNAAARIIRGGVILLHDFIGRPVQEAVEDLMDRGFKTRVYLTPHMVAACWIGDMVPPDHRPDPNLPDLRERCPEFDWSKVV